MTATSWAHGRPVGPVQPLRSDEGYFAGADSVRLFYRKLGSSGEPVVFLHGGPGSNFRGNGDLMEPLAVRRTLVLYDQRGSGFSEIVSDPQRLRAEDHVRDLEALREHFQFRKMTLIGLSWGAGLAALYAAQHPDRVKRLLLISPMPPTQGMFEARTSALNQEMGDAARRRRDAVVQEIRTADDARLPALCREFSDLTFSLYLATPTSGKLRRAAERCDIPPAAIRNRFVVQSAAFTSLGPWDFRPMLARLRMPALVLEGSATRVPLEGTREWVRSLPRARLYLVRDAGHELFLDQPGRFLRLADEFLKGRYPRGAVHVN